MRVVIQRSREASVSVDGEITGRIDHGLVVLVGVTHEDTEQDAKFLADKVAGLRIFEDDAEKMNLSVLDTGGQILSISQFTLYGDARKGRRPNFMAAARPEQAKILYEQFNDFVQANGIEVATGIFGAMMDVQLVNSGPVTIILDSKDR
ncbi:MAG: D-tyrosyl-tRNA(Tyr) deacylase [Gorillibacterium sp.]|nr:D-tyrosyl-tRNA(Tyr) deacylase [Gorillibacterium sp.]